MVDKLALPILIVEDDVPTQNLLSALLRRFGYTTEIAAEGAEAIARLRENDYALVILDMMMPRVDGRAVIDFLATGEKTVPVIVCSAAGPRSLQELPETVVKAVFRKPFDIDQLVVAIQNLTGSAS